MISAVIIEVLGTWNVSDAFTVEDKIFCSIVSESTALTRFYHALCMVILRFLEGFTPLFATLNSTIIW